MAEGSDNRRAALSGFEWAIAVALVLACVLVIAGLSRHVARTTEAKRFESVTDAVFRGVGERVVETRGVMKSMLGMHYASDEFAGTDIEAFAEQLRAYSPFVRGIGLFGLVDGALREDYEAYRTALDGVPFEVRGWEEDGTSRPVGIADRHFPIESIDPLDGPGRRLLGTDVASVDAVSEALGRVVASGRSLVVAMPPGWPIEGDALVLQPVYAGAQPPGDEPERLDTVIGGVWVAIDLERMLGGELAELPEAAFALSLDGDAPTTLIEQAPRDVRAGVDLGFGTARAERAWRVGDTRLVMTLDAPLVVDADQVASIVFAALLVGLLGAAGIGMFHQRRAFGHERASGVAALEREREKAERTLRSISDAVMTVDRTGRCLYVNPTAARWFDVDPSRAGDVPLGASLALVDAGDGTPFDLEAAMAAVGATDVDLDVDVTASCGGDRRRATFALRLSRMVAGGGADGFLLVMQNVSKERELTAELERRAHRDTLTGCYNRFYFERCLTELVEDPALGERRHALCYIDLDQFKIVNDTCGHAAGDRLLCELVEGLSRHLREGDVFARLGGDEFGVILRDAAPEAARRVADELYGHFQGAVFEEEGNAFPVRASMGLVEIGGRSTTLGEIMKAADIACYAAKDGGRNALVVYSEDDESLAARSEEMSWLPVLERAIAEDRFVLLAQPIRSIGGNREGTVRHHEFLLRLEDESGELLTPHRFIRAAERYDLMRAIDRRVIEQACRLVSGALASLPPDSTFAINLSGQSAADPSLLPFVASTLETYGLEADRFWFEITETAAITHFANAVELIEGLHALGARVALDDFGSGLSSFGYLRDLPVDVLKIDGQFVRDVARDPIAREMVGAMHRVARSMGLSTVAEFVEDEATLAVLETLGVDYAQGWHIGYPDRFEAVLPGAARPVPPSIGRAA